MRTGLYGLQQVHPGGRLMGMINPALVGVIILIRLLFAWSNVTTDGLAKLQENIHRPDGRLAWLEREQEGVRGTLVALQRSVRQIREEVATLHQHQETQTSTVSRLRVEHAGREDRVSEIRERLARTERRVGAMMTPASRSAGADDEASDTGAAAENAVSRFSLRSLLKVESPLAKVRRVLYDTGGESQEGGPASTVVESMGEEE